MSATLRSALIKFVRYMFFLDTIQETTSSKKTIGIHKQKHIFCIKPFRENEYGVSHWDTILKNMVSLGKQEITFFIRGNQGSISMYVALPKDFAHFFENTFYANYPTSDLVPVSTFTRPQNLQYIKYKNPEQLKTKEEFTQDGIYMDPFVDILGIYSNIPKPTQLDIVFSYRFEKEFNIRECMRKYTKKIAYYLVAGKQETTNTQESTTNSDIQPSVFISLGFTVTKADKVTHKHIIDTIKKAFVPLNKEGKITIHDTQVRMPVSYSQAVNIFHMPTKNTYTKGLEYTLYRKLPYPTNIPTMENTHQEELTILGTTDYRAEKIEFGIKKDDKLRHIYIVGKTGTGKSTLISNMIRSDMHAGSGLALLDPHGDLVDIALDHIPRQRINDVILFDVADTEYPIGFNLLQYDTEEEKNRIVSGVVSAFYRLFAHSRGPRLEYILRNVLLSIVEYPNATLMHVLRVLVDDNFRDEIITHISDPLVLKFWKNEFLTRQPKQREEAISPITNKIGQFLSSSIVRNIFGQPNSKLNLRKAMDESKIILINLSKGKIGEDNAAMIGSLLVTKFQIDAMSRADITYTQRKDFYLYIDEFQNFATTSFTTILSEARKYKLSLIVANQFTNQLLPEIKDAIFGNIGTIISFTLGHDDATIMSAQLKGLVTENDIISLPKFTAYCKLMIDGISSDPFSMKTKPLASPEGSAETRAKIISQSRQRYALERSKLEQLLYAWSKKTYSRQEKVVAKALFEGMGLDNDEIAHLQDPFVQENIHLFQAYALDGTQPDAIIFDTQRKKHKAVRYTKPTGIESNAELIKTTPTMDIYRHHTLKDDSKNALLIIVGDKQAVKKTAHTTSHLKFVPNIYSVNFDAITSSQKTKTQTKKNKKITSKQTNTNMHTSNNTQFSINDIQLGQDYTGYVKLMYNYGIFVTVKGVEGLLHKKDVKVPEGVDRKKYFTIGDKITVYAKDFKIVNGEKKVVWAMR